YMSGGALGDGRSGEDQPPGSCRLQSPCVTPTNTPVPPTVTTTVVCPASTPTRLPHPLFTPAPGCSSVPPSGDLSASIIDGSPAMAVFRNHSTTCSYLIGLASYQRVDNNIDHQILYDYQQAVIPPHTNLTLTVVVPPCAYQLDAFYGEVI